MPSNDPDCPFCKIVRGDDPNTREVYRDEYVVAFFPTEPATLGHTLVIPHEHIPNIWHLDEVTATQVSQAAIQLAGVIKLALTPDGLNLIQSNGEAATQTVDHFHVHLVPRWHGDAVGPIWPLETDFTEAQKNGAWELLREAWSILAT